jgi:hypothetical protein
MQLNINSLLTQKNFNASEQNNCKIHIFVFRDIIFNIILGCFLYIVNNNKNNNNISKLKV